MPYQPSADRTRSRQWRAGSRRNKKHPTAHVSICPMPHVCLVHSGRIPPRHPAMAMRLTRCEQKWVDDIRAGRIHTHLKDMKPWQTALLQLRQRLNTKRMAMAGIINEYGDPHYPRSGYHNVDTGPISAQDYACPVAVVDGLSDLQRQIRDKIIQNTQDVIRVSQGLRMGVARYGRR